jgi:uncharacterized protein (DUF1015 family)
VVELKPFRRLHYNPDKIGDVREVLTLPYDIISERRQDEYYRLSEYNFVRIILGKEKPDDNGDNKYRRAKRLLDEWLAQDILVEDEEPALFVYEEEYQANGHRSRQAGIIGLVKVEPFENGVVLPHEKIYDKPVEDRYRLLEATHTCLEAIMGLVPDKHKTALGVLRECRRKKPELDFTHDDDIRHRLWKITDEKNLKAITKALRDDKVIIADGHHRYTTTLRYACESKKPGSRYIMMLLLSMEDNLKVLPIHRLLKGVDGRLVKELKGFEVKEVEAGLEDLLAKMQSAGGGHAWGMYDGGYRLLKLKDKSLIEGIKNPEKSEQWNNLDTNLLQSLIIAPVLGCDVKDAIESCDLAFIKDAAKAVEKVDSGEYEVAFFLNPTGIDHIKAIAEAGERMPQKSTFFYPKPLSGLLMHRL